MNLTDATDIDRRRFLATCAVGACAVAVSGTGCASLTARPVSAVNGVVHLSLDEHPELKQALGSLKILPTGERDPLYVLTLGNDRFAALSPVCTHRGCTVDLQGEQLVCPCHGSTYDRNGGVLRGPAERPLRRFAARSVVGGVEINLREPA